jgi:TolB-like protein
MWGRRLGGDAVVTGRIVQKDGDWVIEAELLHVSDRTLLWSAEFPNQTLTSVCAVQD